MPFWNLEKGLVSVWLLRVSWSNVMMALALVSVAVLNQLSELMRFMRQRIVWKESRVVLVLGMREMPGFLEQWQLDAGDLRRRMY